MQHIFIERCRFLLIVLIYIYNVSIGLIFFRQELIKFINWCLTSFWVKGSPSCMFRNISKKRKTIWNDYNCINMVLILPEPSKTASYSLVNTIEKLSKFLWKRGPHSWYLQNLFKNYIYFLLQLQGFSICTSQHQVQTFDSQFCESTYSLI